MNSQPQSAVVGGLAGLGRAGCWEISVDEASLDDIWILQVDGPNIYVQCRLADLNVLAEAIAFLESRLVSTSDAAKLAHRADLLILGSSSEGLVELVWDDETWLRCFLVIRAGECCVRVTLSEQDARMWLDALGQVAADVLDVT